MNNHLCPQQITLRTEEEMNRTSGWAYKKYRLPGVIGMVDGTHIAIVPPQDDPVFPEFLFVNRKHYHSMNTQIICDHQYKIWNVNARFPGSAHDSFIWKQSSIRSYMLDNTDIYVGRWLLGDSGYPLEPICIVPFKNPNSEGKNLFNDVHSSCRSVVERCIGVLKVRWRCLRRERGLHYDPSMSVKIINTCAALHNFCISHDSDYIRVQYEFEDPGPSDPVEVDARTRTLKAQGEIIQEKIIGHLLQRA